MNRRQFFSRLLTWCFAVAAFVVAGCNRGSRGAARAIRPRDASKSLEDTTTSATAPRPEVQKKRRFPDLAVAGGADPERNLLLALEALGGIERFVGKGQRVAIKPNLTHPMTPEHAVTTNPRLVGALVRLCREAGAADVVVFDRGGESQKEAFRLSGVGRAVRNAGGRVKELRDEDFEMRFIPRGRLLRSWPIAKDAFEADVLINVPIAKHHNLAGLTMGMKNLMGLMGGDRSIMHEEFAQRIVDLNTLIRPDLVVLDAHRVLVRNGPISWDLADVRTLHTLIVGINQVSVDAYGATLFGKRAEELDYLVKGDRQGLGEMDLDRLRIAKVRGS